MIFIFEINLNSNKLAGIYKKIANSNSKAALINESQDEDCCNFYKGNYHPGVGMCLNMPSMQNIIFKNVYAEIYNVQV